MDQRIARLGRQAKGRIRVQLLLDHGQDVGLSQDQHLVITA